MVATPVGLLRARVIRGVKVVVMMVVKVILMNRAVMWRCPVTQGKRSNLG